MDEGVIGLPRRFFPCLWERRIKLDKQQKQKAVSELREDFSRAKAAVITHYKGMSVPELNDLRSTLRALGVDYRVVKNTLARIASDGTPVAPAKDHFRGPAGIAIGYDDPVKVAQGIMKFVARNDKLKPVAAVVEGKFVDADELRSIAELPPREVLLGMVAGTMAAPLSKMAAALQATVSTFGYALKALERKKQAAAG